jgi:D-inositol-3-phosphate glycosyltransferase
MAHCVPVVGTGVGGIRETVVSEETGLLVPPKSPSNLAVAIDRLLSDHNLCERMGQAGRQRCEEIFSLETHVATVVRQYELVLDRKPAAVLA